MRLVTDMIEFCSRAMPRWHPISISGYHIREAGSTAQQELAFTLKDGLTYVEAAIERGIDVDEFAPRLSFFFNAHIDFFEEIAKYRAARRIWARELRDTYGARDERSLLMRFHSQTAGVSLTAQQPLNNLVRTALEALSAVLGGTQSLHTNSYDEALALPTEEAVRLALRTQQIIAHETGVTNTIDPLGGSYFVEALTDRMEAAAYEYFRKIDELGGMVEAIKQNYPQREIADASFRFQEEVDRGERIDRRRERLRAARRGADPDPEDRPAARDASRSAACRRCGRRRDGEAVEAALGALREAAAGDANLMEPLLDCAAGPLQRRARSWSRSSGSSGPTPRRRSSEMKLRAFAAAWTAFTMLAAPALLLADEVPPPEQPARPAPAVRGRAAARARRAAPRRRRCRPQPSARRRAAGPRAGAGRAPAPEPAAADEPEADAKPAKPQGQAQAGGPRRRVDHRERSATSSSRRSR